MNRSITSYYKKLEKEEHNPSAGSNNNSNNNSHNSNSSRANSYKMHNTSGKVNNNSNNNNTHRQTHQPYNKQNHTQNTANFNSTSSVQRTMCDSSTLYASSSWVLPPTTATSFSCARLPQTSSQISTLTTAAPSTSNVTAETIDESSTSPSSIDLVLLRGWSPVPTTSTDTSHWVAKLSSRKNAVKRKRQDSLNGGEDDPDLGSAPPLAKRKQTVVSPYKSDADSVVSSAYPSPVDEYAHEIDTRSSCDYLATEADFDVNADDIPDSPNSLRPDDEAVEIEDEVVSATTSPSACSVASSKESHHLYDVPTVAHHGERTPGQFAQLTEKTNISTSDAQVGSVKSFDDYAGTQYSCMTPAAEPELPRQCPLPALSWANADDVWQLMCKKDEQAACLRSTAMLERHPSLQPRMRAILLDWLIEVCEVYKLHRETYYLAVDYLDRYLSVQKNVQKTHLQLIGITSLFVAAKVEEIYPPKIGEFAYVTDGACQESDILQHEVLLLQALEWSINPVTPMGWLGVYMQLNVSNRTPASFKRDANKTNDTTAAGAANTNDAFIYPQFSGMEFVQTAQLLDLCSLDTGIADYGYSIVAAAAMSHTFNREIALRCSGFDWQTIEACARWMQPFFQVVREESTHLSLLEQNDQIPTRFGLGHICPNIVTDDSHIIQTHTISMAMFDRAVQQQEHAIAAIVRTEASPATGLLCPEGLLTPPASSRKPVEVADVETENDANASGRTKNAINTVTSINPLAKTKCAAMEISVSEGKDANT